MPVNWRPLIVFALALVAAAPQPKPPAHKSLMMEARRLQECLAIQMANQAPLPADCPVQQVPKK